MRHALIILTVIVLAVLGTQTLLRSQSEWQTVYVRAGGQWLVGHDFYTSGIGYAYPPFMAMVAAPLASAPEWLSRLTWFAFSAFAMVVMVIAAWRLANGAPLDRMTSSNKHEWYVLGCGLAIGLGFIFNAFAHQQTDVLIGGLLMAGALWLRKGSEGGGALIGLAAACKASPLLWAPYLLWRGRWAAGVLVVIVSIAVNLLPDLFVSSPNGGWWLQGWFDNLIWPSQNISAPLGMWASAIEYNQSLAGTVQRLVNTKLAFSAPPQIIVRQVVDAVTLKFFVYAIFMVLIAISVTATMRAQRRPFSAALPGRDSYEFSMVFILMLLMSPMSGRPHFGTLLLPAFGLARYALTTGDRTISAIVGLVVALVALPYKYLVPENIHAAILWGGVATAAAMLLWIGCVLVLWRDV